MDTRAKRRRDLLGLTRRVNPTRLALLVRKAEAA